MSSSILDDSQEFLARQKALADMPEDDIDDYEARMRLQAKRRKLWKSVQERAEDPSQTQREREESELVTYLRSLESSGEGVEGRSDKLASSSCQGDNCLDEKADVVTLSTKSPGSNLCLRSDSTQRKTSGHRTSREPGSSKRTRARSAEHEVNATDTQLSTTSEKKIVDEHPSPDADPAGCFRTRMSKNGIANPAERVLKKRKGSDEWPLPDTSNITSPSNSPTTSSSPMQVTRSLRPRPTIEIKRNERRVRKAEKDKKAAERKKQEELEKSMTPREYAAHVQSKFTDYLSRTSSDKLPLHGKAIFYIGGDYHTASQGTRKKMDFLRKKGATVIPSYDPEVVTHIVTEGNASVTLKALGLKSLKDIPTYIPTLTWSWVTEGRTDSPEFWFAAFPSRIDASSDKTPDYLVARRSGKSMSTPRMVEPEDETRIEDFTVADHQDGGNKRASGLEHDSADGLNAKGSGNDPLAEFYDQARKEAQKDEIRSTLSDSENNDTTSLPREPKSRWTCDNKPVDDGQCVNQDIVDKLSELEEINKTKISGDPREQKWRVFSYGKSIRAIRAHPTRIRNFEDAISIRGIGRKTAEKIVEIIKTGDLKRIKYDRTQDVEAIKLFNNIYGVGLGTAEKWYAMGCRTLEDVKNRKGGIKLSDVQEIGIKYYDDINTRIPRREVEEIFTLIKSIALGIDPKLYFQLMGSYRRGAETCGDIDILMSRPTDDRKTHRGVLRKLLRELHSQGILTEDLAVPEDFEDLEQTYRGLCRRDEGSPRRRIDILAVPYHERGGALIYYTGDDIFNRAIRLKARKMGYSLSQHGLAMGVARDERGKKMVPAEIIASETEEEIFHILGVPWQEPRERIRALKP